MGKTSYRAEWEKFHPWLSGVKTDKCLAYCKICLKTFRIDNSGLSQVKSHAKSHGSDTRKAMLTQRTFTSIAEDGKVTLSQNRLLLSPEDLVTKAEVLQALHIVDKNHSFASAKEDSQRFRSMFPDSNIAKSYSMADTKVQYTVKFGIAENLKKKLIYDVKKVPYSFLFDETTNINVKKQYDAYLSYWSKHHDQVVCAYMGSLFVGHCNAENLVEHYEEFVKQLQLDSSYLLHLSMDGPNVNLSFENKLAASLDEMGTFFLRLGSCSLHPTHTAFRKGIKKLHQCVDIDEFFTDIHFFFKLSSARREDYASLVNITDVVAEYAKKHAETRWLSMKYVALRCLEQWPNLKEYFLNFLPRQKNFKSEISKTQRYIRIKTALTEPLTEAYISFVAFVAHDFESFLLPFQSGEPMIHLLHPAMCKLLHSLQSKFIRKKFLPDDTNDCIAIDVNKKENIKYLHLIDIGTKAKVMFSDSTFFPEDKQTKFRKDCLQFYVTSVQYLQEKLPFNVQLLKHAQYLHPEKRNNNRATSAISNLALKITTVLEKCLSNVFSLPSSTSKEEVVDRIRDQWILYQNEDLNKEWYLNSDSEQCLSRQQQSYWKRAEEQCGLNPIIAKKSLFKRIDYFWKRIGEIRDDNGSLKFPQLFELAQCVLSLSHGNSTPERGFSINKIMLEAHGYTMYEDTIVALRIVKDELNRVGGVTNFNITSGLISDVKASYSKYEADRIARKALADAEAARRKKELDNSAKNVLIDKEVMLVNTEIVKCKASLKVADDIIDDAKTKLQEALAHKKLDRDLVQQALSKIEVGTERKRKFEGDLDALHTKKKTLTG